MELLALSASLHLTLQTVQYDRLEVGGAVTILLTTRVLTKRHIEASMLRVFNSQVLTDRIAYPLLSWPFW